MARRALLIGATDYGDGFDPVTAAAADVELIDEALTSRGFECDRVSDEIVGNQADLDRAISDFCKACGRDDLHVVYFSGHGIAYKGHDYIVPAGVARDEARRGRQIVHTDYSRLVSEEDTGHVLFIIDACRDPADSGDADGRWGWGGRESEEENRFIRFLGCGQGQQCWTRKDGTSVFTRALADVLIGGVETSLLRVLTATRSRCRDLAEYEDRIQEPRLDLGDLAGDEVATLEFFPSEPVDADREWLEIGGDDRIWVVVLQSESATSSLADTVDKSLKLNRPEIERQAGKSLDLNLRTIEITEALASPRRWRQFLEALCKAPILVADATGFEPGVMLCLGVRAVVRRGVTLTVTSSPIDQAKLSEIPFNIQEIKLIGAVDWDIGHPQYPINFIGLALAEGLRQLQENPTYQDLPGFDSVRCLEPPLHPESVQHTVLVLCPFAKKDLWAYLSKKFAPQSERLIPGSTAPRIARMLDLESPRLVGPALYEHLRWSKACIVDWSDWRANVFFELGVRLACNDVPPVNVIVEDEQQQALAPGSPTQHARLLELFQPTAYQPQDQGGARIEAALADNRQALEGAYVPKTAEVPPNCTYDSVLGWYDWHQERSIQSPDEELRWLTKSQMGEDPQMRGSPPALFSKNKDYLTALRRCAEERWLAAWRYLRTRYSDEKIANDPHLQNRLAKLGEEIRLSLSERKHKAVFEEIDAFKDAFPAAGMQDQGKQES